MKAILKLADIQWDIRSERPLHIGHAMTPFLSNDSEESMIYASISWDWENALQPTSQPVGKDVIQTYYHEGEQWFCMTRGGRKGNVGNAVYTDAIDEIHLYINEKPFIATPEDLDSLLRFFPVKSIFQHYGVLFLHAAQVSIGGKGIVFVGPSGMGKTTQSELWVRNQRAKMVCGDRTLIRRVGGTWYTYGFPIDGSMPVYSSERNKLMCIVVLNQADENIVVRLNGAKAIANLMSQMVIDGWNPKAHYLAMNQLAELTEEIPVYKLSCTPDERAVECLKQKMNEEGIWQYAES